LFFIWLLDSICSIIIFIDNEEGLS
jgi:hypothetical protein